MIRALNAAALVAGLAAVAWVAFTHAASHPAVLPVLGLILAAFLAGGAELRRYRAETAALLGGLQAARQAPPQELEPWIASLPQALQLAVRLRLQGERAALPGPLMTPYLTGLLVLLGLLGTFLGMVAALGGTVQALGTAADLQAVRSALASPVQGLGLAFGTSVAGVAASASLGLLSALAKAERTQASHVLDAAVATTLQVHTEMRRRGDMLKALEASAEQARALPAVAQQMEAAMLRMVEQQRLSSQVLEQANARFLAEALDAWSRKAVEHTQTLRGESAAALQAMQVQWAQQVTSTQEALSAAAERSAQDLVRHSTAGFADFLDRLQQHTAQWQEKAAREQVDLQQRAAAEQAQLRRQAAAEQAQLQQDLSAASAQAIQALREQTSQSVARDREQVAERERLLGAVDTLMQALQHAASEQAQALDGLLASAAQKLDASAGRFDVQAAQVAQTLSLATEQAGASSQTLAQVGASFAQAIEGFSQANTELGAQLARVEAALGQHLARSDEQLAYYVAQAREVIELSLGAQQQLLEGLRQATRGGSTALEAAA